MLHFALACNLLISTGGHPRIAKKNVPLKYPSELPSKILPGVECSLGPLTKDRIKKVFLRLECP
jgi:Ferritin-like